MPSHLPAQINQALHVLHSIETKGALTAPEYSRLSKHWLEETVLDCQYHSAALLPKLQFPAITDSATGAAAAGYTCEHACQS